MKKLILTLAVVASAIQFAQAQAVPEVIKEFVGVKGIKYETAVYTNEIREKLKQQNGTLAFGADIAKAYHVVSIDSCSADVAERFLWVCEHLDSCGYVSISEVTQVNRPVLKIYAKKDQIGVREMAMVISPSPHTSNLPDSPILYILECDVSKQKSKGPQQGDVRLNAGE